eukprot:350874-Chlamydomonas_euryale.AAC.6
MAGAQRQGLLSVAAPRGLSPRLFCHSFYEYSGAALMMAPHCTTNSNASSCATDLTCVPPECCLDYPFQPAPVLCASCAAGALAAACSECSQ